MSKDKEPSSFWKKKTQKAVVVTLLYASGIKTLIFCWSNVAFLGRVIKNNLWYNMPHKRAERRTPIPDDTFEEACKRHEVTPERLQTIMQTLQVYRRFCWILLAGSLYFWVVGFWVAHPNMIFMSLMASVLFFSLLTVHSFRLWQCRTRTLKGGFRAFWNDKGLFHVLKF